MFPLVPNLISDDLNLIVALVIGIAFGFILEQAGFSSSRKLAGVFYGYDFTVLRVFFTAGVTAMSGVIILGYLGWLDTDFIYINPTFLPASILGGVIMGFGFIIGGYCPGTSVAGMAIGKIDAMFFVGGGLIGVFTFAELYSWFEPIANAGPLGGIRIFNSLGISQGLFALALIAVAVGAFIVTTKIEKKVANDGPWRTFHPLYHQLAGAGVLVLGVVLLFLPDYKERIMTDVAKPEYLQSHRTAEMSVDEFAFRLMDRDPKMTVIDVRPAGSTAALPMPGAVTAEPRQLFTKEFSEILGNKHKKKVFVGADEISARTAAAIAERMGYENIAVLCGGADNLKRTVLEKRSGAEASVCPFTNTSVTADVRQAADTDRFRAHASVELAGLIEQAKHSAVKPTKMVKKVAGGC